MKGNDNDAAIRRAAWGDLEIKGAEWEALSRAAKRYLAYADVEGVLDLLRLLAEHLFGAAVEALELDLEALASFEAGLAVRLVEIANGATDEIAQRDASDLNGWEAPSPSALAILAKRGIKVTS